MKIIFLLSAAFTFQISAAQSDTLPDKNNPAQSVATPDAGVNDKTASGQKQTYKIEPEKNAEILEDIKQRKAIQKQKTTKKHKGRKSNTSKTQ